METKGIIFTYSEIEKLNELGYLTDYQLMDDNGGDPYGNCVIVDVDQFLPGEIKELGLENRVEEIYYTNEFDDRFADCEFIGKWYAKGCTGEAMFEYYNDYVKYLDYKRMGIE